MVLGGFVKTALPVPVHEIKFVIPLYELLQVFFTSPVGRGPEEKRPLEMIEEKDVVGVLRAPESWRRLFRMCGLSVWRRSLELDKFNISSRTYRWQ